MCVCVCVCVCMCVCNCVCACVCVCVHVCVRACSRVTSMTTQLSRQCESTGIIWTVMKGSGDGAHTEHRNDHELCCSKESLPAVKLM